VRGAAEGALAWFAPGALTAPPAGGIGHNRAKAPVPKPRRRAVKMRVAPDPRFSMDVRQVLGLGGPGAGVGAGVNAGAGAGAGACAGAGEVPAEALLVAEEARRRQPQQLQLVPYAPRAFRFASARVAPAPAAPASAAPAHAATAAEASAAVAAPATPAADEAQPLSAAAGPRSANASALFARLRYLLTG